MRVWVVECGCVCGRVREVDDERSWLEQALLWHDVVRTGGLLIGINEPVTEDEKETREVRILVTVRVAAGQVSSR